MFFLFSTIVLKNTEGITKAYRKVREGVLKNKPDNSEFSDNKKGRQFIKASFFVVFNGMNPVLLLSITNHRTNSSLFAKVEVEHDAYPVIYGAGDGLYIIRYQEWKMNFKKIPKAYLDAGFAE
jgi:hypothetical protein